MDPAPNCAICNAPAYPECPCESERLEIAVRQAEKRAMEQRLIEIRDWVIIHSRTHILQAFERLTTARKAAHSAYLSSLPYYSIYMQYSGHPPLHPAALAQLQAQISDAHSELKRGIDADWRASVLRYPEVLDYFYSLVELRLPSERAPSVAEPPFAVAGYADRGYERIPGSVTSGLRDGAASAPPTQLVTKKKSKRHSTPAPTGPTVPPPIPQDRVLNRKRGDSHVARVKLQHGPPPVPTPPVHAAHGRGGSHGGRFSMPGGWGLG